VRRIAALAQHIAVFDTRQVSQQFTVIRESRPSTPPAPNARQHARARRSTADCVVALNDACRRTALIDMSSYPAETRFGSEKSFNFRVLVSVAIVAIGLVIATYALAVHPGVSPNELGLMSAYP
jgi:hypothetical protein